MAIKDIICGGIGFSPGSTKFIPTRGFIASSAVADPIVDAGIYARMDADSTSLARVDGEQTNYPRQFGETSTYARP